jgi:hypothetical protein
MRDVQSRALALRSQGTSVEDAGRLLQKELAAKYPDWPNLNPLENFVRRVYAEAK